MPVIKSNWTWRQDESGYHIFKKGGLQYARTGYSNFVAAQFCDYLNNRG